jgi:Arf-GAP/coiled-coil/ANK repeat/PH domain-containing protein
VQAVTALRLFAFDKQHNSSPASSSDFGFREAMSSFKSSPLEQRNGSASHSAVDLRTTAANDSNVTPAEKTSILHDDQNSTLLRTSE